jgi:phage shock protein PspC (stress-responsive transcriptional regulator)
MKEITRIHLAKIPYEIEIEAKKDLEKYLNALKKYSGDESIFQDVEVRMTEILAENGVLENGIISKNDTAKIRAQIGEPEVFRGDDFEENDETTEIKKSIEKKKLYRVEQDSIFAGVATGLAEYFKVDVTWVRVVLMVLLVVSFGTATLLYFLLAIITPKAKNASDILRLRGEPITASAIKTVNQEFDFEKSRERDRRMVRIIAAICGLFASLTALGGIVAIVVGNIALNKGFNSTVSVGMNDNLRLLIYVLCNFAGVMFVIFWFTLAHACFTVKFSRNHFIALMMSLALGVTSAIGVSATMVDAASRASRNIESSAKVSSVLVDKEALSKIKAVEVDSSIRVEYIVSNKNTAEIGEYEVLDKDLAKNIKFEFSGELLKISGNFQKNYFGRDEVLRIYGPELTKISTQDEFDYYISQDQASLEVILGNGGSADFEIHGLGRIVAPKIFYRNGFGELVQVKQTGEFYED